MDTLWGLPRALLVGVLLAVLLLRVFEDRFIYFPSTHSSADPEPRGQGLEVEDVFIRTADGIELHAWYATAPGARPDGRPYGRFTLLYLHGNAGNLSDRIDNIAFLRGLPVNVLALDYRGYGRSQGRPSEAGLYRDAEAAYDYLTGTKGVPVERLVVLGQSLGTAVAAGLAARLRPYGRSQERQGFGGQARRPGPEPSGFGMAGLILEGGFPSARRVASRTAGWLPGVGWLMRTRFDAASALRGLHLPVLVAHCREDPVIPFDLGEELFQAANEPKTFVELPGACHEPLYVGDAEGYAARLREFLARLEAGK